MTGQKCSTLQLGRAATGRAATGRAATGRAATGRAVGLTAFALSLACLAGTPALAQDKAPDKPKGGGADEGKGDKPPAPEGRPKLPGVDIDMKAKTLKFRGFTALKQSNQLEVLLATPRGKTHEALLVTDVDPQFIQTALLLIGLKPKPQIKHFGEVKAIPEGEKVVIEIEWKQGGKVERHRVEDLIFDRRRKRSMIRAGWVFTGSRMIEIPKPPKYDSMREVFAARHRGNIGVMYHDPDAMLDTPLFKGGDDTAFQPYPERLPERMTPVTIHVRPWQKSDWKGSPDGDVPVAEGLKPTGGAAESQPGEKPAEKPTEKTEKATEKTEKAPKPDKPAEPEKKAAPADPKSGG